MPRYNSYHHTNHPAWVYALIEKNTQEGIDRGHTTGVRPTTMSYFMNELKTKCLDGTLRCYTDDPRKAEDIYDAGPYQGIYNPNIGYSGNMPSSYALQGIREDYAESFRVVVVSAYKNSGANNYIEDTRLIYNIGKRYDVMKAIINGAWSLWNR
jgi:hypothetical protein